MSGTRRSGPDSLSPPARRWRWLIGIFLLALVARLVVVAQLSASTLSQHLVGDGRFYEAWARRIAAGEWIGHDPFFLSPLYAYLLGGLYWLVGPDWQIVRVLHAFLGAATCVLVARASERIFDRRAGIAAGIIAACYAPLIWTDITIHKTVVEVFLTAGFVALFARMQAGRTAPRLMACGALVAGLALTRENAVVLLPLTGLWVLIGGGESPGLRWRGVGALALGFLMVMGPFVLRNRVVTQEWATTYNFGPNFYIGNNRNADGLYDSLAPGHARADLEAEDVLRIAEADRQRALRPSEVSRYWFERTVSDIRDDPLRWMRLLGRKWMLLWGSREPMDTEAFEAYADDSGVLAALSPIFRFDTLVPLAVLGMWISRRAWRQLWLLHAAILALAASITLIFVFARFRMSLIPMLLPFAGLGAASLVAAARERRWTAGIPGIVLPIAAAGLMHWPLATHSGDPRATTYSNHGDACIKDGQPDEALSFLRKAVLIEPGDAVARNNLAVALSQTGQADEALLEFRNAVQLQPDYADAQFNLSAALVKQGDLPGALAACRRALAIQPMFPEATSHLGYLLYRSGDIPGAIDAWKQAAGLDPADVTSRSNLAAALARIGRTDEAIETFREVLRLDPNRASAREGLDRLLLQKGPK